jgi:hypothetical protein
VFALNYALAAVLLTTTNEPPESAEVLESYATVRPTVQALAMSWEILDPREARYMLTRPEEFSSHLTIVRRRCVDFADAPPLYDCMRFPDRPLVNDLLTFNRAYRQHLDNRQALELDNAWDLREMVLEADRLYQVWDTVRDTRCDYYYITVRRQALKKLKESLGEQAYYSGCLPPHVPVWRFGRMD